jgi:hypothetical protein
MVSGFRIVARLLTDGAVLLGIPQDCERAEKKRSQKLLIFMSHN